MRADASVGMMLDDTGSTSQRVSTKKLIQRIWNEIDADNVMGLAAQMSYYFVLAFFPFLIFLAALVGTLPFTDLGEKILRWITIYLPANSQQFVFETVTGLMHGRKGFLSFGMLGTAWAASVGLLSLMNSLNVAYEVKETRNFFKRLSIAFLMLFVFSFSFLGSFALLAVGDWLNEWLVTRMGFTALLLGLWHIGRWILSLVLLAIGIAVVDHILPNLKRPWRWINPGSLFAVLAWLPVTLGFDFYVRYLASYDKTYGALATSVILMVWVYIIGLIILIGAEINSELWKMRAAAGRSPTRKPPERLEQLPQNFPHQESRAYGSYH
ncbi:MAG: YihY/virulence factor BrkB family protein [Acidobacteria bacterium]|nr:YihY/virulence factor BrkB family protein [Acidobacteriota bacterium]